MEPVNLTDRRRRVIRTDGSIELLQDRVSIPDAERLLKTDTLDTVRLRHLGEPTMVMLVIDDGWHTVRVTEEVEIHGQQVAQTSLKPLSPKFPINELATELYLANCIPGTTHRIAGDVVIAPDSDFARGEQTVPDPEPACMGCGLPFKFGVKGEEGVNVFTEAGRREVAISGLCEECFDALFADDPTEAADGRNR
jgi:hypothetical protein